MKRILVAVVFVSLCSLQFAWAAERLAILPVKASGLEAATSETVYSLLTSEIRQLKKYEMVPEGDILALLAGRTCSESACAVDIGRRANAAKVVFGSLNKLGEKIIFQYCLVNVASGETLVCDDLAALRVEDLDQVTKRVAASIDRQIPADKTVEFGLVTEQESQDIRTRKSSSSWGIGFGYLYPQKGYDDKERVFVWDFRSLFEIRHLAVDALLGIRKGIALNVGVMYLPSLKDFSPYAGAGVGFHAVSHKEIFDPYPSGEVEDKHGDGFEFLMKAGFLAFRTYDFRIVATVEYSVTLNDYDDGAVVVTIGVMRSGTRVFGIF